MTIRSLIVAGLLAAAIAMPVQAESKRQIEAPAGAPWKHAQTGITLPPSLLGIARGSIGDNSGSEIDVFADYGDGQATVITLYVFRPALASVPMWFDRSEAQILMRDVYANATPAAAVAAFAPPGGKATSALRRIYVPGKGPYKSTGLAIMPMGEWLVAVRISSQEFDATALDAKLDEVIKALGWPGGIADADAAVPVAACATPLTYAKRAKIKPPNMMDALLGATLATVKPTDEEKAEAVPVIWCREGAPKQEYGVYRAVGSDTGYTIAMGDAGRVINVFPGLALDSKDPGYQLSVGLLDQTLVYPSFDKLPAPEVAVDAVMKNRPVSSAARGGKNITIEAGGLKAK
ncbi:MAG: hypothetical protein ACTHJR_20735 [Sphingomonas sp.]|uniref:hypothetical protein n=1 Tax=Sphingomonas sp. TaxID=28214 RepID=UPI003F82367D